MNEMEKKFGKTARDIVTGFEGVITGACLYLSGCAQYLLAPKVGNDGMYRDGQWFDASRIEVDETVTPVVLPKTEVEANPGCDKSAPVR